MIRRVSLEQDLAALKTLVREHEVGKIVVGLPRRTDGSYGPETEKMYQFGGEELTRTLELAVEYWDERFSTVVANRVLLEGGDVSRAKRRKVIDKVAATVILQAYLDHRA